MLLRRATLLVGEFATLILFWAVYWPFGIKPAIAAVVVYIIGDAIRRLWWRVPFSPLYVLSSTLAVGFGAIDLWAQTPFMIQYEAVITNAVIGAIFVAGARGERPLIQNIAEDWVMEPFPVRPDIRRFFALFTLAWAAFFFLRSALYLWLALTLTLERALAVRAFIGIPSLVLMVALSTQGRHLFAFCRYMGWIPPVEAVAPAET